MTAHIVFELRSRFGESRAIVHGMPENVLPTKRVLFTFSSTSSRLATI